MVKFEDLKVGMFLDYSDDSIITIDLITRKTSRSIHVKTVESNVNGSFGKGHKTIYPKDHLYLEQYFTINNTYKITNDIKEWIESND